eukprot:9582367-Alexandrium_andersonii.AAC.1
MDCPTLTSVCKQVQARTALVSCWREGRGIRGLPSPDNTMFFRVGTPRVWLGRSYPSIPWARSFTCLAQPASIN